MKVVFKDSGEITFSDGNNINRNSLNRKTLIVNLETDLAIGESLWVQFGDSQNFEDVNANILEPIRLSSESDGYKTIFPDEVVKKPGTWFMTFAVRMYSTDGTTFSSQLTSEKVSFVINDSFPLDDDGYISNGTLENVWQDIQNSLTDAEGYASAAENCAQEAADSASQASQSATAAQNAQSAAEKAKTDANASAEAAAESAEEAARNAKGLSMYLVNEDISEEGPGQVIKGSVDVPQGYEVLIGDLILSQTNGNLGQVNGETSTTYTYVGKGTLRGEQGASGVTGAGVYGFEIEGGNLVLYSQEEESPESTYQIRTDGTLTITFN